MGIADTKEELNKILSRPIMEFGEKREDLSRFVDSYSTSDKAGILKLVEKAKKEMSFIDSEIERVGKMMEFENKYSDEYYAICGCDEVGRGPFAGPVVTAAVILPKDIIIPYINDSKQVPEKIREELYDIITDVAVSYSFGIKDEQFIDEYGIKDADLLAMRDSVLGLGVPADMVLVDAFKIPDLDLKQVAITKGDTISQSIAAASIIAKVKRDRFMDEMDEKYPEYGFKKHKGYGTADHIAAIKKYGPCPIHRRSFIKKYIEE